MTDKPSLHAIRERQAIIRKMCRELERHQDDPAYPTEYTWEDVERAQADLDDYCA
jgi:hypothetical protein